MNTYQSLIEELYAERGEILDAKYNRTQQLISGRGWWTDEDIADLKEKERELTDQIEIAETFQWFDVEAREFTEQYKFVCRIGGKELWLDMTAVKESLAKIKARYEAGVNHSNDGFWAARRQ